MSKNVHLSASLVTNSGKETVVGSVYVVLNSICHLAEMQPAQLKEVSNRIMAAMAKDVSLPHGNYSLSMHEVSEREYFTITGALQDGDEEIIEELSVYETFDIHSRMFLSMFARTNSDNEEFRKYTRLATIVEKAMTRQSEK